MSRDYVTKILKARVYDVARETPLELAPKLSARLGSEVWLKREDLQPVFSFKLRGAYNKLASLTPEERARGVIASSAGNHAQGVALAARRLGTRALIVMPETAPRIKVDAVESLGAEVVLAGDTYDGAKNRAEALAAERGMALIPPYDDEHVIAGQGTVGMEIVRQQGEAFDAIFVSVGGGGLIAGIAAYIKALWPETRIIGVEPQDTPTLHAALAAGERVVLEQVGTFADGVAVKQIGAEPFRIARECIDEVVLVSTDEICAAIKDIFEDTRAIAEPAGALARGRAQAQVRRARGGDRGRQTLVAAVESGANRQFRPPALHFRAGTELGEHTPRSLLAVTIPERKGSLLRDFCDAARRSALDHRVQLPLLPIACGCATSSSACSCSQGASERTSELFAVALPSTTAFRCTDLTDNELAKLHIRHHGRRGHAVGAGLTNCCTASSSRSDRGHLTRFLNQMGRRRWNISHVPLPQPRLGLWPGADRPSGARGRARRFPVVPRPGRLRLP